MYNPFELDLKFAIHQIILCPQKILSNEHLFGPYILLNIHLKYKFTLLGGAKKMRTLQWP